MLFATLEVARAQQESRTLIGKDSVGYQFTTVSEMTTTPSHGDLNILIVYGGIFKKQQSDQIMQSRNNASEAAGKGQGPAAGTSSSSRQQPATKAGNSRVKTEKAKALDDMTKALFSRR